MPGISKRMLLKYINRVDSLFFFCLFHQFSIFNPPPPPESWSSGVHWLGMNPAANMDFSEQDAYVVALSSHLGSEDSPPCMLARGRAAEALAWALSVLLFLDPDKGFIQ